MKILITGNTSGIGLKLAQDYLAAGIRSTAAGETNWY